MSQKKHNQLPDNTIPHRNYEQIVNEITRRYPQLSERFQQAARYITQNPNTVALESINAIAAKCGMHPSVLVRLPVRSATADLNRCRASSRPGWRRRHRDIMSGLPRWKTT